MDDARIRQLTEEVLAALQSPAGSEGAGGLEARVAALERAVSRLQPAPGAPAAAPPPATVHVHAHPALQVIASVPGGGERCVLEPDKPCVQSGACRSLGH
jgi:hypothetical protein